MSTKDKILEIAVKHELLGNQSGLGNIDYSGLEYLTGAKELLYEFDEIDSEGLGKLSVEQAVNSLILEKINNGDELPPWKKSWASKTDIPAQNFLSKEPYSGSNAMILNVLLGSSMPTPYYLTYNQAKKLGGSVKEGAKSIPLVYYNFIFKIRKLDSALNKIKGKSITRKGKKIVITEDNYTTLNFREKEIEQFELEPSEFYKQGFLRYYKVFNVADTEGIEYEVPKPPETGQSITKAEQIIKSFKDAPTIKNEGNSAYYVPHQDTIYIPNISQFDPVEEYYTTLFHELVHSTLKETRLNRKEKYKGKEKEAEYAFEELIAELGASYIAGVAGIIDVTHLNSAAYLKGWHKKLQKQTNKYEDFFIYATKEAKKAADYILKDFGENTSSESKSSKDQYSNKEKIKAKARAKAKAAAIKVKLKR